MRVVLLASTALSLAAVTVPILPATAQDATWLANPGSGDFNTGANWSGGSVPTGTASFDTSSQTALTFSANASFGGWTFNSGASSYTFTNSRSLEFAGTGIVINGGSAAIINDDSVQFLNSSNAGNSVVVNNFALSFSNSSTAGDATITNNGVLNFNGTSTAGNAAISNNSFVNFFSAAGSATIANTSVIQFRGSGTADSATITNAASIQFIDSSTAGSATITTSAGGLTAFADSGTGGTARFITNAGGTFFISSLTSSSMTAGSIEGAGDHILGANALTVGSNNRATEVSGVISGTGGSLIKTGTGTLILSGANTYTGGTTVDGGTLQLGTSGSTGSIVGAVTVNANNTLNLVNTNTSGITGITTAGLTRFREGMSAGNLSITTSGFGQVAFSGGSSAGNATLVNNSSSGAIGFNGDSTAGNATITNVFSASLNFNDSSTAGSANIVSAGFINFNGASTAGNATITDNGGSNFSQNSTAGNATIINNSGMLFINSSSAGNADITNNNTIYFLGATTAGSASITNASGATLRFDATGTAGSASMSNAGTLEFYGNGTAGSATITNGATGILTFNGTSTAGNAAISGTGTIVFNDTTTAGDASLASNNISFNDSSSAGSGNITSNFQLRFFNTSTAGSATITSNSVANFNDTSTAGNATITNNGTMRFFGSSTGGLARLINGAGATIDLSVLTAAGTAAGSIEGAGTVALGSKNLEVGGNNRSMQFAGVLQDGGLGGGTGGSLTKTGTGTLTLSGTNTYTGATTVDGGTLAVNGTLTATSGVTVNSGAALGGTGFVGNTTVNAGGALAPGNSIGTITVNGNLTFNAGGVYTVEVSPTAADRTNVTGTATLTGATVQAIALPGSFRQQTYTILNATGGFGGTQFAGLTGSSFAPGARNPHLTYDTNNVYLVLDPGTLQLSSGASGNQSTVAGAINNAVLNGAAPPPGFDALLNMSGSQQSNALNQISGQPGAAGTQTSFNATQQFMGMLDPSSNRGGSGGGDGAMPFAADDNVSASAREAYAAVTPRDRRAATLAQRWSIWATGYGGASTVNGNSSAGTSTTTSRVYGTVVGADYRIAPETLFGFALGGAGTSFALSDGLGSGKADLFQAGLYGRHQFGAAYISAALSYGWQDVTTDRTVTVSGVDRLTANYKASTFAARGEAGWRLQPWSTAAIRATPYAALQVTSFRLPGYSENVISGSSSFALTYAAQTTTNIRTELGSHIERPYLTRDGLFTLRGRLAWAHDSNTDRPTTAAFQNLPGSSFTTNGARPAADAALVSAGAKMDWLNGFSLAGSFEGEFSSTTRSYAGKATFRYAW